MKDGHIHSHYCPHGTSDSFEMYIENAIKNGYDEISFTEHFPLPDGFVDPSPEQDSTPSVEAFERYLDEAEEMKKKYRDKIKINVGTEVDYLEGYEEQIKNNLEKYGKRLDDALLSVHNMKVCGEFVCIDYSPEEFKRIADLSGGVDKLYGKYYETVKKAIESDLGEYKPKRFGHLNLIRKFCKVFEYDYIEQDILEDIMKALKENGFELDLNVSGIRKPYCGEVYVSGYLKELADKYDIKTVLGSDSHTAETIVSRKEYEKFTR